MIGVAARSSIREIRGTGLDKTRERERERDDKRGTTSVCLSACLPVFLVLVDNFIDVPICSTPRLLSRHLLRQDMDPTPTSRILP